jgi:hypothetical protein
LQPEEQLFFSVTIMPFGKFSTPDIDQWWNYQNLYY